MHHLERHLWPGLLLGAFLAGGVGCVDSAPTSTTSSGTGATGGAGGSGSSSGSAGGGGGTSTSSSSGGGAAGVMHGAFIIHGVSGGALGKSDHYRMAFTVGQPVDRTNASSSNYQIQSVMTDQGSANQ